MCTVTIVPTTQQSGGWRMACSRDELHGRPAATPPQSRRVDGVNTLMPIDPSSGGTWVGVNDAGLALTLLNYNLPDPPTDRDRSRGSVITALLGARSVDQVVQRAAAIPRERMMPFRLVACDGVSLLVWSSTEPVAQARCEPWSRMPIMFTSSGLGDHLVQGPRRELFDEWFGDDASAYGAQQDKFHRHRWPGREHLSVAMDREDARTVSYTTLEVDANRITMVYHPDRPDLNAIDTSAILERRLVQR